MLQYGDSRGYVNADNNYNFEIDSASPRWRLAGDQYNKLADETQTMSPQPQSAHGAITQTHDTNQPMTTISATILSLWSTTLISMGRHATKQRWAARGYKQLQHCASNKRALSSDDF